MTTVQKTLITTATVAAVGTGIFEARQASRLRDQVQAFQQQQTPLAEQIRRLQRERDDATNRLTLSNEENARLKSGQNVTDLLKLRGQVALLRHEREDLSNQLAALKTKNLGAPAQNRSVDTTWVQHVLNSPPQQQGMTAGALRGKLLRGEMTNISRSELVLQEELTQRKLNHTLERSPADFADFQTGFIQATLGISDATQLQQIHELIRQTYEQAVANGLDIPSEPGTDEDAWVQRRFQLDRQATEAVKQFLTPEEQSSFDRAFLGLMGVDLGVGVDKSNYPKNFLGSE